MGHVIEGIWENRVKVAAVSLYSEKRSLPDAMVSERLGEYLYTSSLGKLWHLVAKCFLGCRVASILVLLLILKLYAPIHHLGHQFYWSCTNEKLVSFLFLKFKESLKRYNGLLLPHLKANRRGIYS